MIETPRLLLRRWRDGDIGPFTEMNQDPDVMRYFPSTLTRAETEAMVDRIDNHLATHRWGLWAIDRAGEFIGFAGLNRVRFEAPFTPAVEVGWRLAAHAWGRGYATEAASAALRLGFAEHRFHEIVSFTVPANTRSTAVMERLGMTRDPEDDFDHPALPEEHPLRHHLLYRISTARWRSGVEASRFSKGR